MKNLILIFLIISAGFCAAQDAPYGQWHNVVITPEYDQLQAFGESLHEHNKMYHQNAPATASVWRVDSGPNIGKWVLSSGPHTFGDLDNMNLGNDHMAHWRNKVMPTIEEIEDGGTWRMQTDYSYLPAGMTITKARVVVHNRNNDASESYYAAMKKLAEATEQGMPTQARILLRRVGFHNDHMDSVVFLGLNNWADLDKSIVETFEKVHGEGSWNLFLEEIDASIESSYEEHWTHIPYLSGIGGPE